MAVLRQLFTNYIEILYPGLTKHPYQFHVIP